VAIGTVYVAVTSMPFLAPIWREMDTPSSPRQPVDAAARQLVA